MALETPVLKLYNGGEGKPGLMTVRDLSKYLNFSEGWVYENLNRMPHVKIGRNVRFRKEDIDEWLSSQEKKNNGVNEKKKQKGYSVVDRHVRGWKLKTVSGEV